MNKNYYLLWTGQFISATGTHITNVIILFWLKHMTGSASLMSLVLVAGMIPTVLIGPFGGVVSDRISRKRIIVVCNVVNGFVTLSLALCLQLFPAKTSFLIYYVTGVMVANAISLAFFNPAIISLIPDLVTKDRIDQANSLRMASYQIAMFIGQGVGGVVFMVLGVSAAILIDGLSFWVAAVFTLFISSPPSIVKPGIKFKGMLEPILYDLKDSFRFVKGKKGLMTVIWVLAGYCFILYPITIIMPFYVEDYLKESAKWYGYLLGVFGVGSLLGYTLAGVIKLEGEKRGYLLVGSGFLGGLVLCMIGLSPNIWISSIFFLIAGVLNANAMVWLTSSLQQAVPSEIRGRVFGLINVICSAMIPVSMAISGIFTDLMDKNIPYIFVSYGSCVIVLMIPVLLNRNFINFFISDHGAPDRYPDAIDVPGNMNKIPE